MTSIRTHRRVAAVLLLANVPVGLSLAIVSGMVLARLDSEIAREQAEVFLQGVDILGMGQTVVFVVAALAFLAWYHRAHQHLLRAGGFPKASTVSPVIWFVVPIVNVVYPLLALRSLRRATVSLSITVSGEAIW